MIMDTAGAAIMPFIGGIILFVIIAVLVRMPGNALRNKFVALGTLKGKTFSEIQDACGEPSSISSMSNGRTLRQWMATGYHIALIFDEKEICQGVSHEAKS